MVIYSHPRLIDRLMTIEKLLIEVVSRQRGKVKTRCRKRKIDALNGA